MPCGRESPRKNCSRPFPEEQPAAGSCPIWGRKMAAGDYAPGFYIKHFIKDMGIALAEAEKAGLALPVLSQVLEMYRGLEKEGPWR